MGSMNTSCNWPAAPDSIPALSAQSGPVWRVARSACWLRAPGVLSILLTAVLAACGAKPGGNAASSGDNTVKPPIAQGSSEEFHYDDPCSLLEPKEVEAVFGAPLAIPPFRAGNSRPTADGEDCVYQTADFHQMTLTVEFRDGAQAFRITGFGKKLMSTAPNEAARKALMLDDGTELTGEWDEAQLTALNCCIFNALRGDQMITIDFTGSDATLPQAAALIDAAFKRIDKPLKVDGASAIAAAKVFAATRPAPRNACDVLSRAEVEAVIGPLASEPKPSGTLACSYSLASSPGNLPRIYELNFTWQGGYAAFRSDAHVTKVGIGAMGGAPKAPEDALPKGAAGDPWERAGVESNDFVALKKDVRIKIDQRFTDREKAKALVAAAMRKI
jgi:hypothetical protein